VIRRLSERVATTGRAAEEADFLAVQDPSWADLKTCRERDECLAKLRDLGVVREAHHGGTENTEGD